MALGDSFGLDCIGYRKTYRACIILFIFGGFVRYPEIAYRSFVGWYSNSLFVLHVYFVGGLSFDNLIRTNVFYLAFYLKVRASD